MDFLVLGPFEVADGAGPRPIGGLRQRAVLALLTIHAGEALSTDQIVEEIWAGSPPPSAVRTVHSYVSRLRSALRMEGSSEVGPELLIHREPGYLLALDKSRIDAYRFEAMVDEASALLKSGEAEAAGATLGEALSLWRGTAYADFAYEPFAANESRRLMERRIEATELRLSSDLALARHASVVAELEGLVIEHPLRESLWAQLMVALYRCGRQAEALAAYSKVRRTLVEELGIEPGPELRRLEQLVLQQSDELAWRPIGDTPSSAVPVGKADVQAGPSAKADTDTGRRPTRSLPLVGRDQHLRRLMEVLHGAQANSRAQLAVVTGEAGCGKTRLLSELARHAHSAGDLVGTGSAERDTSLPYGPFAQLVRSVVDAAGVTTLERVGHLRSDLTWLLPELGSQPAPVGDLGLARVRLFEAVIQLLARAGSGERLLVVIDDVHRIDSATASLLEIVLDRTWPRPVVVVLGYRTAARERHARLEGPILELLRREGTVTVDVGRLSSADLASLIDQLDANGSDDRDELVGRLSELTGGIALLVREVVTSSNEQGVRVAAEDAQGPVSLLVEGVIGHRIDSMSKEALRLLEPAAVIGMSFEGGLLADLTGQPVMQVADTLEEVLDSGLVAETEQYGRYAFDHGLIREVLIGMISAGRRTRLHGRVAMALAERGSAVEAARHGLRGRAEIGADEAARLVVSGADAALDSLEFETASGLCEETLSDAEAHLPPGTRVDLLLRLGRAESLLGWAAEADTAWQSAADLARSIGDDERFAAVALATDPQARMLTEPSELRWVLLTEALERSGPGWSHLRLLVASEWLTEAAMPARRAATPAFVEEVIDEAHQAGDQHALVAAYHARHVLMRTRQLTVRREWSEEFLDAARNLGADEWLFQAHLACLITAAIEANGPGLDYWLDELRLTCARYGAPRAVWIFELAAATCLRLRGEFDLADERADAAHKIGDRHGITDNVAAMGAVAFLNAFHRGGLRALRSVLEPFATSVPEISAWSFGAGLSAADDDDMGAARTLLDRGLEALTGEPTEVWLTSVCLAAELSSWVGAEEDQISRLEQLLAPFAGQFAVVGTLSSEFGPTDRCLGLLAASRGALEEANEHFARAIATCERLGAVPWELRTRADMLVCGGRATAKTSAALGELEDRLEESRLGGTIKRLQWGLGG